MTKVTVDKTLIDRDALIDAIAQGLHGTWHCTRVWEAWHVGTMSQDDFEPVDESETPTEIADAVLAKWGQPAQAAEPVARTFASHAAGEAGYCLFSRPVPSETPLYAAPQPVEREPLTDEQIQDLLLCGDPTDEEMRLIRIGWDAANGIKGGQHGTDHRSPPNPRSNS